MSKDIWAKSLARMGVRPQQVEAWAAPFAQALNFPGGRAELVEFLTQSLHETAMLAKLVENLNYSVNGLLSTFGRHRITVDQANMLGRVDGLKAADQKGIANVIYGGEWGKKHLGNVAPDDGWNFRGSGLIHTTGRDNFQYLVDKTGIDCISDPDKLRTPSVDAVKLGIAQWQRLVKPEMLSSPTAVRKAINGGTLGLDECAKLRAVVQSALT